MFDLDQLPFDTLNTLPEEKSVTDGQHQNGTVHQGALAAVARAIHGRHPAGRRDCGVGMVERQLAAILKHKQIGSDQRDDYLRRIDANHAGICAGEQWQKDNGAFVKGLSNWLAPAREQYDVEAPSNSPGQGPERLMA